MTDNHILYIVRSAHEINGRLCSHAGRICLIVPNYTEVTTEPVETKDESVRCYQIEVKPDEVVQQADAGRLKYLLWLGDTQSRSRPQDMLTLPIASLVSVGTGAGPLTPKDAAAALFAGYPDDVKVAGVIANTPDEVLAKMPIGPAALKTWAGHVLAGSTKAAAAGAG